MISKGCGDGDFSQKKLVKWLFQPLKVGDLVILLNYGDGDLGSLRVLFSKIVDLQIHFLKRKYRLKDFFFALFV